MLKLTHGSRSHARVSSRKVRINASAKGCAEKVFRTSRRGRRAFDYWQLRVLETKHGNMAVARSERFRRAGTLEADWNFCRADSMQGARAGLLGLLGRSNSV